MSVRDPLSGYFLIRREFFHDIQSRLRARGWKLLLEILALCPKARISEIPFTFRPRLRGQTKMDTRVVRVWLTELWRLRALQRAEARVSRRFAPIRSHHPIFNVEKAMRCAPGPE
jgi:dolichol-phosphate mannosyltransferase